MRFAILLVVAVVAVVIAVAVSQYNKTESTPVVQPVVQEVVPARENLKTANVLFAKTTIPVGTEITDAMVDIQPYPEHLVLQGFVVSGADEVVGKVARSTIQAQTPFIKSQLANKNDPGFLAGALPAGMRAITIATDAVSGLAGYVFPGDRVDVVFAHDIPGEVSGSHPASGHPELAEVLVSGVRVLAVNVRDVNPNNPPQSATPTSVTLEVSDADAQRIRLAERLGTLSLALRSVNDGDVPAPTPTRLIDLSHADMAAPVTAMGGGVLIVRGPGAHGAGITANHAIGGVEMGVEGAASANTASPAAPAVGNTQNNRNY